MRCAQSCSRSACRTDDDPNDASLPAWCACAVALDEGARRAQRALAATERARLVARRFGGHMLEGARNKRIKSKNQKKKREVCQ